MHVGVPQLDGLQQAGVPELEPRVRQGVEGEVDGLRPLAGTEEGSPHGTQHPAAQGWAQRPHLSSKQCVPTHRAEPLFLLPPLTHFSWLLQHLISSADIYLTD